MGKLKVKKDKNVLKTILLVMLLILSYISSAYVYGFTKTNARFFYLIVFSVIGFCLFYIVYYIIYFITYLKYKRKDKNEKVNQINCDDKVNEFLKDEKYKYIYDTKLSVQENFKNAVDTAKSVILGVATLNNKKGKYFYLNYSVYDALEIYGDLVAFAYDKIDGVFKFFKIQNKPITFIEKSLQKVVEEEIVVKQENKNGLLSKIKQGVGNAVLNTGIFLFKNKIQDAVNEILSVVCLECFKVYSKGVKSSKKVLEQELEVQNA